MKKISIEKFAKIFVDANKGENINDVKARLEDSLKRKNSGATCQVCGSPIWAIGSALGGFERCFTCITGESDHSNDYEVK